MATKNTGKAADGKKAAPKKPGLKKVTPKKALPKNALARRPKGKAKAKDKSAKLAPAGDGGAVAAVTRRAKRVLTSTLSAKMPRRPARLPALERLELAILDVRHGVLVSPRTRKLLTSGVPKMAQKVIEEAGEVAIEALQGHTADLVNETVDLFYNTLVLLAASGVTLEMLWAEMDRREMALGMAEKLPKPSDPDA